MKRTDLMSQGTLKKALRVASSLLLALQIHSAWAVGSKGGNGGDVVVCNNGSVHMLDKVEAEMNGAELNYPGNTFAEKIQYLLNRFAQHSPRFVADVKVFTQPLIDDMIIYKKLAGQVDANEINRRTKEIIFVDAELSDINDSEHRILPKNCQLKQLAGRFMPRHALEKDYVVSTMYLDKLSHDDLAVFILHEAIYRYSKHDVSVNIRGLNGFLASEQYNQLLYRYLTFKDYLELVNILKSFRVSMDFIFSSPIGTFHSSLGSVPKEAMEYDCELDPNSYRYNRACYELYLETNNKPGINEISFQGKRYKVQGYLQLKEKLLPASFTIASGQTLDFMGDTFILGDKGTIKVNVYGDDLSRPNSTGLELSKHVTWKAKWLGGDINLVQEASVTYHFEGNSYIKPKSMSISKLILDEYKYELISLVDGKLTYASTEMYLKFGGKSYYYRDWRVLEFYTSGKIKMLEVWDSYGQEINYRGEKRKLKYGDKVVIDPQGNIIEVIKAKN